MLPDMKQGPVAEGLDGLQEGIMRDKPSPPLQPRLSSNCQRSIFEVAKLDSPDKKDGRDDWRRRRMPTTMAGSPHRLTPWYDPGRYGHRCPNNRLQLLHQEILDFVAWIDPTEEERYARHLVVRRLQLVVEKLLGNKQAFQLQPFGSYDTGLYLPTSDIDVVIAVATPPTSHHTDDDGHLDVNLRDRIGGGNGDFGEGILRRLTRQLYKMPQAVDSRSIRHISHARIPIVKYVDRATGFEVDVSVNVGSGLDGARMIRQLLREHACLRPLTLVLKHFLSLRRLNEVFTGGLGSFALICLLVSFVQHHPLIQGRLIDPMQGNLGILLVDFLELYGVLFHYDRVGISLRNGGRYFQRTAPNSPLPSPSYYTPHGTPRLSLCIEDPQNPDNDVSKGSFGFDQVRDSFRHAFHAIIASLELAQEAGDGGDSLLGCILWSTQAIERHRQFIQTHTNL
jgi:non-canonical poly(A) RNA polymerase PAPD5/7